MIQLISGPPLVIGKYYIYGTEPEKYYLISRFLGYSNDRVLMQSGAGPAEIEGDNLKFYGPYDTLQQAISAASVSFPNAGKRAYAPRMYGEVGAYYYRPFYPYYPWQSYNSWQSYYPWQSYYSWQWPFRRWPWWGGVGPVIKG